MTEVGYDFYEEELKRLYSKIKKEFETEIVKFLKKEQILPNTDKYNVEQDFLEIDKWRISTTGQKTYTSEASILEKEDIKNIKGCLTLTKNGLKIYPSFLFEFDATNSKFSFNPEEVKKIIAKDIKRESWSIYSLLGEERTLNVYNRKKEEQLKKLQKDAIPLLKGVGFSEDESNLMVVGALKHNQFKDDMTPEGLVGLALRVRGEILTNTK